MPIILYGDGHVEVVKDFGAPADGQSAAGLPAVGSPTAAGFTSDSLNAPVLPTHRPSSVDVRSSTELRLFISSTFTDFLKERDHLAKKVFPALRRLCRERGIEFTEVDLRWGLTDEDANEGRILESCFQEIDRCRPFFVGMLGDRYGWVPPLEELSKNPGMRAQYPWVEAAMRAGKSATEMEFLHGFLNEGAAETLPLLYFRTTSGDADPRVVLLKEAVSAQLGSIPTFRTPEELGSLLERDLSRLVEQFWPASKKDSWLDEERAGHAAFAQSRRKGYVANPSLVETLDAHLEGSESVLVLTGESGSGKSSLLSYWGESVRRRKQREASDQREPFIIEHYVGVTTASTDPDTIMRRIAYEIRERIHSDEPIPQSSSELVQMFPSWLGRLSEEPLLIIVDAINQFSTEGRFLSWLPDYSSANIKWIISSTQGEALERLRSRAHAIGTVWPEVPVDPITPEERKSVLRTFLASYQKKLRRDQEEKIIGDEKSASPLFLRTMLEELRLQGTHEELDRLIDHYLASRDIPDLFTRILERLEFDYGTKNVRMLLTRIWAAPYGLSESEILGSSELDRADLSQLLPVLDYHLIRLKGRLSFFHNHLRAGIEERYLHSATEKENAWAELASFFESTESSATKALSLPWLWRKAGHWQDLHRSLLELPLLPYLTEGSHSYDLLGFWVDLDKQRSNAPSIVSDAGILVDPNDQNGLRAQWTIDVIAEYENVLALGSNLSLDASTERDIRFGLALFFHNAGWPKGSITNCLRALEISQQAPDAPELTLDILLELGTAYLDTGDARSAAPWLERAMERLQVSDHRFDIRDVKVRNEYARLLQEQAKYSEAESNLRTTLRQATENFGPRDSATQHTMRLLADVLGLQAKYPEAESLHREVLKSIEASLGPESLEAGYYLNQLADFIRRFGGDYREAQHLFERAVQIIERRLGDKHPDLAVLLQNFGSLLSLNGEWKQAEPLFLRSLSISEIAHGPNHPAMAMSLNNYAGLLFREEKYEAAETPYRRALDINRIAYGENHPVTAGAYTNLGNLLGRLNRCDEAEECFKQALKIRMETIGLIHVDTARTLFSYGRVLRQQGKLLNAERLLRESLGARKQISGTTHPASIVIAVELAEVLLEQNKIEDLSAILRDIQTLERSDHPMARDLDTRLERLNQSQGVT